MPKLAPAEFSRNIYKYKLVERYDILGNVFCIYEQTNTYTGAMTALELHRIRVVKKDTYIQGNLVASAGDEKLSGPSGWGVWAWTFSIHPEKGVDVAMERARQRMHDIMNQVSEALAKASEEEE